MKINLGAAKDFFQNALKNKLLPDTQWMVSTLERLETGEISPKKSMLELKHRKKLYQLRTAKNSPENRIDLEKYTRKRIFPPRPGQTRLAVTAAQKAEILTLHGPSRTGKTTSAVRAALVASCGFGRNSIFSINGMQMSCLKKDEMEETVHDALKCPVIILDDIDKGSKGDVMINGILQILEARDREHWMGVVILTTNLFGKDLSRQFRKTNGSTGDSILVRIDANICIDFGPEEIDCEGTQKHIFQKLVAMDPNNETWIESLDGFGSFSS